MSSKALDGKRIAVTRPEGQEEWLASRLSELGAVVYSFPLISIQPCYLEDALLSVIQKIKTFDWVCFTSANGVNLVMRFAKEKNQLEHFRNVRVACIGLATQAALEGWGFQASLIPEIFQAEGLLASFQKAGIRNKKFLLLRAKGARDILREALTAGGGEVLEFPVYEATPHARGIEGLKESIADGKLDCITFTSSSTVQSFKKVLDQFEGDEVSRKKIRLASIGPITSESLRAIGLSPHIEAKIFSAEGLASAIEAFYRN